MNSQGSAARSIPRVGIVEAESCNQRVFGSPFVPRPARLKTAPEQIRRVFGIKQRIRTFASPSSRRRS